MHPADQVQAFAALFRQGLSEADIGLRFGLKEAHVRKLLKLGRVAKAIMSDYRKDRLSLEQVQAYALVDDSKRQLACYRELGEDASAFAIRRHLVGEAIEAGQGIGAFVGITAYENAGGALARDLFAETVYLQDTELVERLALDKLARQAAKVEREGQWAWVNHGLERDTLTRGRVRLTAELIDVPAEQRAERERLEQHVAELEAVDDDAPLPDEFADADALYEAIDAANEALWQYEDALEKRYSGYTAQQRALAGVVVTLNWRGELEIIEGLARPQDVAKTAAADNAGSDRSEHEAGEHAAGEESEAPASKPLSQALIQDLAAHRRQITRVALLDQPALAADLLHYSLCVQVLSERCWEGRTFCDASFSCVPCTTDGEGSAVSRAGEALTGAREALNTAWLAEEGAGTQLAAFRVLGKRDKARLVTYCTAQLLQLGPRGESAPRDALVDELAPAFRAFWQPTEAQYFKRLTTGQLLESFAPVLGEFWAESQQGKRKGDVIESLKQAFAEDLPAGEARASWIPRVF